MFDVAIVGSGPAGGSAALALVQHGLKVALLERERLPRYKTCGGGLVARASTLLPAATTAAVERRCERAELHLLDADLQYHATRDAPIITMTMRDRLDLAIASDAAAAGADLRAPCAVTGVTPDQLHVRLDTAQGPVTAGFVIAADGAASGTARRAGWPDGRHLIPALEYEIQVDDRTFERFAGSARFDVGLVPCGYAWVFPKATHLSVGVLTARRGPINLHSQLEAYLRVIGLAPRAVERHGFVIPVRPRPGPLVRGRVLLVGDAAGLADPVTAEGISFAVRSGRVAAEAILAGGLDPERVAAAYAAALAPLLRELRVARALARVLYRHPRARRWLLARLGQEFVEAITDVCSGARTYRGSAVRLAALALRPRTRLDSVSAAPAWPRGVGGDGGRGRLTPTHTTHALAPSGSTKP
jgi:geranylgeranyl reductase family protein